VCVDTDSCRAHKWLYVLDHLANSALDCIIWQRDNVYFLVVLLSQHCWLFSLLRLYTFSYGVRLSCFFCQKKEKKKTAGQKATTVLELPGPVAIWCNNLSCFPLFLRVCFEEIPLAYLYLYCLVFKWWFVAFLTFTREHLLTNNSRWFSLILTPSPREICPWRTCGWTDV